MPKLDDLNILGTVDTQVSEPGPSWPSYFYFRFRVLDTVKAMLFLSMIPIKADSH